MIQGETPETLDDLDQLAARQPVLGVEIDCAVGEYPIALPLGGSLDGAHSVIQRLPQFPLGRPRHLLPDTVFRNHEVVHSLIKCELGMAEFLIEGGHVLQINVIDALVEAKT